MWKELLNQNVEMTFYQRKFTALISKISTTNSIYVRILMGVFKG